MNKYYLKLYITGRTSKSDQAIVNLRRICKENFKRNYKLIIIDTLEKPQLAENEKIIATLIKELPLPIRRIIGDLSDREKVLLGLDVQPCSSLKGGE